MSAGSSGRCSAGIAADGRGMGRRKSASFEEQMKELNRLVDEVGREDCPLDELESKVKRAAELIGDLRSRLAATEMSVKNILVGLSDSAGAPDADARDEEEEDDEDDDENEEEEEDG